jgi:hypothetical protein
VIQKGKKRRRSYSMGKKHRQEYLSLVTKNGKEFFSGAQGIL